MRGVVIAEVAGTMLGEIVPQLVDAVQGAAKMVFSWWADRYHEFTQHILPWLLAGDWWQAALKISGTLGIVAILMRLALGHLLEDEHGHVSRIKFVLFGPIISIIFYIILGVLLPIVVLSFYLLIKGPK